MPSELNFEAMKRILSEPAADQSYKNKEKQKQLVKTLKEKNFDDLVKFTESKVSQLTMTLDWYNVNILIFFSTI